MVLSWERDSANENEAVNLIELFFSQAALRQRFVYLVFRQSRSSYRPGNSFFKNIVSWPPQKLVMLGTKPIIKTILIPAIVLFIVSGCNRQSGNGSAKQSNKINDGVAVSGLTEKSLKKNNAEALRSENQEPGYPEFTRSEDAGLLNSELPDFTVYTSLERKKQKFFDFLRPIVEQENERVLQQRAGVLELMQKNRRGDTLDASEIRRLMLLAKKYRISNPDTVSEAFFQALLLHVDIIPTELALVQAANESAWGSSYFARKGNNLFGRWCFTPGCGVVPRRRISGAKHEVAVYDDLRDAVRSYILYLNSHPAYRQLRVVRYTARQAGQEPSGYDMAIGLQKYSGIGMEYVRILRAMMRHNLEYMGPEASL